MRTRPTRTQLLSSFAIQIEQEPKRGKPSTAFEAARLFLAVRDKIWSFGIMAQVESDTEEIIVMYWYAKQRRKRKRCVSVHEILQRRSEFGEYHHLVQELHFHPEKFQQYFRMTEEQFDYILQLIADDICKQDTNWKKAITPRE